MWVIAQPLELPARLEVLNTPLRDWTVTSMEWVLSRLANRLNNTVRFGTKRPSITCELHFGSLMETPHILQPGSWTPAPDPAVIVRSDCVEIRRIHLFFSLWHDDEALENTTQHRHFFERPLDFDTLHRVLSERLRFA